MPEDLSVSLDDRRTLWLTDESRLTSESHALGDLGEGGVFVVLEDCAEGRFEVLAKAASVWAGETLLHLFEKSLKQSAPDESFFSPRAVAPSTFVVS